MGFLSWLNGPSEYEKDQARRNAHKKSIFAGYDTPEDYAADHRDDHGGWEEAIDAWEQNRYSKKK